jgi:hypothetical protein
MVLGEIELLIQAGPLRNGFVSTRDPARIQPRREFPARFAQRVQEAIRGQIGRSVDVSGPRRLAWPVRLLESTTILRRERTRFIGIGIRSEHVKTPDVSGIHTRVPTEAPKFSLIS